MYLIALGFVLIGLGALLWMPRWASSRWFENWLHRRYTERGIALPVGSFGPSRAATDRPTLTFSVDVTDEAGILNESQERELLALAIRYLYSSRKRRLSALRLAFDEIGTVDPEASAKANRFAIDVATTNLQTALSADVIGQRLTEALAASHADILMDEPRAKVTLCHVGFRRMNPVVVSAVITDGGLALRGVGAEGKIRLRPARRAIEQVAKAIV